MPVALKVEDVSKQFRIYDRPGDRLKESLTRGWWKRHREFWALKNINFEIERGKTTGIIGPNGSGKSTLLQIITGTLEPTHGTVWYDGRIAALLELGAGFNPEFTGIENVFLNASLLGFSRSETEKLLPEIERFAEIGEFVHQAVKTYSSGMYVRLAFAIASCAEPDILVIDEALAVGDVVFQHRCLRRIKELQEKGTTVLFVSHDAAAVRALCSRAILLNGGLVIADGSPVDVQSRYQELIMEREEAFETSSSRHNVSDESIGLAIEDQRKSLSYTYRHGDGSAEVLSAELLDSSRRRIEIVGTGEPVLVRTSVLAHQDIEGAVIGFLIKNRHGIHIYGTNTKEQEIHLGTLHRGEVVEVTFAFDIWLGVEAYSISIAVHSLDGISYDWLDGVRFFQVTSPILIEGVANLNANATVKRLGKHELAADTVAVQNA